MAPRPPGVTGRRKKTIGLLIIPASQDLIGMVVLSGATK